MTDDLQKKRPHDATRVSLNEQWEVEYWTKALGVSVDQLKELVRKYGNSAEAIRAALAR